MKTTREILQQANLEFLLETVSEEALGDLIQISMDQERERIISICDEMLKNTEEKSNVILRLAQKFALSDDELHKLRIAWNIPVLKAIIGMVVERIREKTPLLRA